MHNQPSLGQTSRPQNSARVLKIRNQRRTRKYRKHEPQPTLDDFGPPHFYPFFRNPQTDDSSQKPVLHALLGFTSCEARGDHRENQHGVEEAERNLGTRIATKSHCAGELPHIEPLPYPQICLEMARKLQSTAKSW